MTAKEKLSLLVVWLALTGAGASFFLNLSHASENDNSGKASMAGIFIAGALPGGRCFSL
jgi:hypothetical protein